MPKFPGFAKRTQTITGSVFEQFKPKMREQGSNLVNLAIGDCYAPPPYTTPVSSDFMETHPGFNRYCDTFGVAALREALAEKLVADNQLPVAMDDVMMTAGACNALATSMMSIVDADDEVVIISPYWPFFRGMVRLAGGKVVEAPLYTRLFDEPDLDIATYLDGFVTDKTVAVYANTPNNPSGKVLNRAQLEHIASFARKHDLWLISDEAYDGLTFDGHEHLSIGAFPGMFERTLSIFTFSKVYMYSGLRLGYIAAPNEVLKTINKIMVHQLYGPATISQMMMVEPVRTRHDWGKDFVEESERLRDRFIEQIDITPQVPEGTYYVFFDAADMLNGREYWDVIEQCLDSGVAVAPGGDFGADYKTWIRVCFTGETPDRVELAAQRLNQIFAR